VIRYLNVSVLILTGLLFSVADAGESETPNRNLIVNLGGCILDFSGDFEQRGRRNGGQTPIKVYQSDP